MNVNMAFESLLATDSLLGMITLLLTTLNINTQRSKNIMSKVSKRIGILGHFLRDDIRIRTRLEKKADWLMNKMGIDIEKFNIDAEKELNGDLHDLEGMLDD